MRPSVQDPRLRSAPSRRKWERANGAIKDQFQQ